MAARGFAPVRPPAYDPPTPEPVSLHAILDPDAHALFVATATGFRNTILRDADEEACVASAKARNAEIVAGLISMGSRVLETVALPKPDAPVVIPVGHDWVLLSKMESVHRHRVSFSLVEPVLDTCTQAECNNQLAVMRKSRSLNAGDVPFQKLLATMWKQRVQLANNTRVRRMRLVSKAHRDVPKPNKGTVVQLQEVVLATLAPQVEEYTANLQRIQAYNTRRKADKVEQLRCLGGLAPQLAHYLRTWGVGTQVIVAQNGTRYAAQRMSPGHLLAKRCAQTSMQASRLYHSIMDVDNGNGVMAALDILEAAGVEAAGGEVDPETLARLQRGREQRLAQALDSNELTLTRLEEIVNTALGNQEGLGSTHECIRNADVYRQRVRDALVRHVESVLNDQLSPEVRARESLQKAKCADKEVVIIWRSDPRHRARKSSGGGGGAAAAGGGRAAPANLAAGTMVQPRVLKARNKRVIIPLDPPGIPAAGPAPVASTTVDGDGDVPMAGHSDAAAASAAAGAPPEETVGARTEVGRGRATNKGKPSSGPESGEPESKHQSSARGRPRVAPHVLAAESRAGGAVAVAAAMDTGAVPAVASAAAPVAVQSGTLPAQQAHKDKGRPPPQHSLAVPQPVQPTAPSVQASLLASLTATSASVSQTLPVPAVSATAPVPRVQAEPSAAAPRAAAAELLASLQDPVVPRGAKSRSHSQGSDVGGSAGGAVAALAGTGSGLHEAGIGGARAGVPSGTADLTRVNKPASGAKSASVSLATAASASVGAAAGPPVTVPSAAAAGATATVSVASGSIAAAAKPPLVPAAASAGSKSGAPARQPIVGVANSGEELSASASVEAVKRVAPAGAKEASPGKRRRVDGRASDSADGGPSRREGRSVAGSGR